MVDRIKALCQKNGMTIKDLEKRCDIGNGVIARWDKSSPSVDNLRKVARYFGVTVSYLLGETENAPGANPEAAALWEEFSALGDPGQRAVRAVIRELSSQPEQQKEQKRVKVIPLLGQRFAAGRGEPDYGMPWEDYPIPEDSKADFAIRISGNSMEPELPDGSVALCRKGAPKDGDVAVLLVDGAFLVKQICEDFVGNLYLFSLNRDRADADDRIMHDSGRDVRCLGTVMMKKKIPLPGFGGRRM